MPEIVVIWGHFQRSKVLQGILDMSRANYTGICCKVILFLSWRFFTTRCFPKPRLNYSYIHWFSKENPLFGFSVWDFFFLGDFLRFWYNYLCFVKPGLRILHSSPSPPLPTCSHVTFLWDLLTCLSCNRSKQSVGNPGWDLQSSSYLVIPGEKGWKITH